MTIAQISVLDLAQRLSIQINQSPLQLIDVREREEIAIAALENFTSLPLSEFADWSEQINTLFDPHAETLVLCHHGVRSSQMCHWLVNQGFTNVKNIAGGIDAYSQLVDDKIATY